MADSTSIPAAKGRSTASPWKSRSDYVAWLDSERGRRGEAWYQQKISEMGVRERDRKAKRDAAWGLWRERISQWGAAGGFDRVVADLLGSEGAGKTVGGGRVQFRVNGIKFEVNPSKRVCCRWDGQAFSNGKTGSREVLGLTTCIFELRGQPDARKSAREYLMNLSGIAPEQVEITKEVLAEVESMKRAAAESARRESEAALREDPIDPSTNDEVPRKITSPDKVRQLTALMARERGFPLEYAQRMVDEGLVWFGTYRFRDRETGAVVETHRPIVVSEVRGFRTGVTVGYASREFRAFYKGEDGKGKNLGAVSKGAVVIGNWGPSTKRLWVTEGVYDASAFRLMRELQGHPLLSDECMLVMAGSRLPDQLVQLCKERGTRIEAAVDNDLTGHDLCADAQRRCATASVPFVDRRPVRGEFTVRIQDDAWGREHYVWLCDELRSAAVKFVMLPSERGMLRLVAETTPASLEAFRALRQEESSSRPRPTKGDALGSPKDRRASQLKDDSRVRVSWHRKDWNELWQHPYCLRATNVDGLPKPAPEHGAALDAYLGRLAVTAKQSGILRSGCLVYPTVHNEQPAAVWVGVDPKTGAVRSYRIEGMDARDAEPIVAGAHWAGAVAFGRAETARQMSIVSSPSRALQHWAGGSDFTVFAFDRTIPEAVFDLAVANGLAVVPDFDSSADATDRVAEIAIAARRLGLRFLAATCAEPGASVPSHETAPAGIAVDGP